jgi:transcriptional regulator with XRE-family HTH domain
MSVRINGEVLKHMAALRGWNASVLAKKAGVVNSTVGRAFAGDEISVTTLKLLATALNGTSVDEVIERLLGRGDPPSEGDRPPAPGKT